MQINKDLIFKNGYEVYPEEQTNIVALRARSIKTGITVTLDNDEICMFVPCNPYGKTKVLTSGEELVVDFVNDSPRHIPIREGVLLGHLVPSAKTILNFQNSKIESAKVVNKTVGNVKSTINKPIKEKIKVGK